ncbi:MAG: hypothetical protein II794_04070, partial [Oscillospiraceae bacterium]|nr:hypothetical protein [Oscillospiraceae bacterium]
MKHNRKLFALVLSLALLVTGLTTTAFAAGIGGDAGINLVSSFDPIYTAWKTGMVVGVHFDANPVRPYYNPEEAYWIGLKEMVAWNVIGV